MLTPRYYFSEDFSRFYDYFLTQPHRKRTIPKGEYLWEPGSLLSTSEIGAQDGALSITQEELSDILGLSRVHLTKGLSRLRGEGIVETRRKHLQILNPQALSAYCSLETV